MNIVMLDDSKISYDQVYEHYANADAWAKEHCSSYQGYETCDISDFSLTNDVVAEYRFANSKDVTIFKLRWS